MIKHIYNVEQYNFVKEVQEIFDVVDLDKIHMLRKEMVPDYSLGFNTEVRTDFHDLFYNTLRSEKGQSIKNTYKDFISGPVAELFDESFAYQAFPSFRVHLPNDRAIHKWHFDSDVDHKHPPWEINFQIALTDVYDSNAMWIESVPGLRDFKPVGLKVGQFAIFNGNKCMHGNKPNDTGKTRMSFDFRVMPMRSHNPEYSKASETTGKGFVVGGYYELFEK
jgi:hypothetical protein|tara:strand:+ start:10568 stop:11230 length:663 start_codon:yes stop_codon:yes gene_type:complete